MSADSPRRSSRGLPTVVPPQIVSDMSIIDSVAGFINDVTLANQPQTDPKDTILWARFESAADISDPKFGEDWELEGNVAPPLLLILGYGLGVQVWAIPANGEAVEVLSWRHGIVSALRVLPTPISAHTGRADEPADVFADKRPLVAICEGASAAGCVPQFCAVNFVSLKTGAQAKTIKFKNPVLDILANRTSVVVTFHEKIAIFDARTLDDRLSVTTCFPSPGIHPNPVALGSRWLAYSESKLLACKRSGGGCDGDGVASYTATVLNAAKSLGKGLRELGEQVAAGLTGTTGSGNSSKNSSFDSATGDSKQPGVVTILDIKYAIKDVSPTSGTPVSINGNDPIVAHFIAHLDAIVAMEFDNSGMLLLTADKRGHDFHVFRIQPHPVGSTLAAVHHLYVLHRGDTSAKVQNIAFSLDSRWVAVSTLRGTTHVFPITPYGGPAGVRTHTSLHVVNKLSRFHRSAGLTADGRSSSPISHSDSTNFSQQLMPYHNPTLPPFPRPIVVLPLAQLRQPFALGSPPGSATTASYQKPSPRDRQRLSSLSDDNGKPLSVCAIFAKSRSWLLDPPNASREGFSHKFQRKPVDSLFVMAGHGALIQYDLDTKLASNVAKEKICDDTAIELDVEARAQWNLGRRDSSTEITPPLSFDNWLIKNRNACMLSDSTRQLDDHDDKNDSWLSQVEIITHAGPHRRLWMGPQVVFKTYNTPSGSSLSHIDMEAVEIGLSGSSSCRPGRSSPLNMPSTSGSRSSVPVLIESGSYSSIDQSPKLMNRFRHEHLDSDYSASQGESRLKEDLADAMRESPSITHKDAGVTPAQKRSASSSHSSALSSSAHSIKYESLGKVVNPLGTVTTLPLAPYDAEQDSNSLYGQFTDDDYVIHENCDESLFRPVVAIFCDEKTLYSAVEVNAEHTKPPEPISNKLIVPVIEKAVDLELSKKESRLLAKEVKSCDSPAEDIAKFNEMSLINKKSKKKAGKAQKEEVKEEPPVVAPSKQKKTTRKSEEREIVAPEKKSSPSDKKQSKTKTRSIDQEDVEKNPPILSKKKEQRRVSDAAPVVEPELTPLEPKSTKRQSEEREIKKELHILEKKNTKSSVDSDLRLEKEEIVVLEKNKTKSRKSEERDQTTLTAIDSISQDLRQSEGNVQEEPQKSEERDLKSEAEPVEEPIAEEKPQIDTKTKKESDISVENIKKTTKIDKKKKSEISLAALDIVEAQNTENKEKKEELPKPEEEKAEKLNKKLKKLVKEPIVEVVPVYDHKHFEIVEIPQVTPLQAEISEIVIPEKLTKKALKLKKLAEEAIAAEMPISEETHFETVEPVPSEAEKAPEKLSKKALKLKKLEEEKAAGQKQFEVVEMPEDIAPTEEKPNKKALKLKKLAEEAIVEKIEVLEIAQQQIDDFPALDGSKKGKNKKGSLTEAGNGGKKEKLGKTNEKEVVLEEKLEFLDTFAEPQVEVKRIEVVVPEFEEFEQTLRDLKMTSEALEFFNKFGTAPIDDEKEDIKIEVDLSSLTDSLIETPSEGKAKKSKMALESLLSFADLPALEPLQPFEEAKDSLINFESPEEEKEEKPGRGFPENNIIFALCGSLHYENENQGQIKDAEAEEQFLSLDGRGEETPVSSYSASEETEGSSTATTATSIASATGKKNKRRKKPEITANQDDDEETRPLIEPNSSNSMTTSQLTESSATAIITDNADATEQPTRHTDDEPNFANALTDTLPTLDNNQASDSSTSDQNNSSEEQPQLQLQLQPQTQPPTTAAPAQPQSQQISKKKSKRHKSCDSVDSPGSRGGVQAANHISIDAEEWSSSSASLEPPSSSPTTSITGENLLHFPGDSSNSL